VAIAPTYDVEARGCWRNGDEFSLSRAAVVVLVVAAEEEEPIAADLCGHATACI